MEAFPFTKVADLPAGEKDRIERSNLVRHAEKWRSDLGDGVFGGAYQADEAVMDQLFRAAVDEIVAMLDSLKQS